MKTEQGLPQPLQQQAWADPGRGPPAAVRPSPCASSVWRRSCLARSRPRSTGEAQQHIPPRRPRVQAPGPSGQAATLGEPRSSEGFWEEYMREDLGNRDSDALLPLPSLNFEMATG